MLAYALSGYWQGFVTGAFATAGLLAGGLGGIFLAPLLLSRFDPSLAVSLGALFVVILCASLGQALLQYAGARVRERITWQPARALDAVGGALLSAFAVLLVAWALGVAISGTRIGPVTSLVRRLRGARQGQRRAAGVRAERAGGLQQRRRHRLLPALPGALRARADRGGRARADQPAAHGRHSRRTPQRGEDPRRQQVRPRGRGHRLRLRPQPGDDQRPRGRGRRGPGGQHRRRHRARPGGALRP
ncbi:CvpA family protein [Nocardioides convexus]|uniref:CvpA family protein n=1 Tax=Nocardioides convexus TaxID=2712224 RepID=UPI0024185BAB|nr:CvpA family protein [Nocardioides convexus]